MTNDDVDVAFLAVNKRVDELVRRLVRLEKRVDQLMQELYDVEKKLSGHVQVKEYCPHTCE